MRGASASLLADRVRRDHGAVHVRTTGVVIASVLAAAGAQVLRAVGSEAP
jgi:hypothetical protein